MVRSLGQWFLSGKLIGILGCGEMALMEERDVNKEIERVVFGCLGLVLILRMAFRLWRWFSGTGAGETIWKAIAGRPFFVGSLGYGKACWDYSFWEVCPDGQLAAVAMVLMTVSLLAGAIWDCRHFYLLAGSVIVFGYLVNACLFIKLLAAY